MAHPRPFRFGIQLSSAHSASHWTDLARRAEDLGYSTLHMPDHFGEQLAPFPALMAAASATSTLRVGSLVLDNDFKHPVVTAKEAATVDMLSDGRLELGIGAGWMTSDYETSGIPMDPPAVRVERLAEAVEILKGLFGQEAFSFSGTHYRISELAGHPRPVQQPHPPLIIGGGGRRLLGLAAREADIVGVNPNLKRGQVDATTAQEAIGTAVDRKIAHVRDAAGDRYDDIELNCLVFACIVTDDRKSVLEMMAGPFGLDPAEIADMPYAWVGSIDEICDQLIAQRERWDMSYLVVQGDEAMTAAAPIVERLAGT
jgi:probable F420-dependent oxidoreductase